MTKDFRGGIPTQIGLNRLKEVYPKPQAGTLYKHEDLAAIVGHPYGSPHYYAVIMRWKKLLFREFSLKVTGEGIARGQGYLVCNAQQHCEQVDRQGHKIAKASRKNFIETEAVDSRELSSEELARHNLRRRENQAVAEAANRALQVIRGPEPVKPLVLRQVK
jgi:hypothetical protein